MADRSEQKHMSDLKHGKPMTPEELDEFFKAFQDIEESIEGLSDEDEEE